MYRLSLKLFVVLALLAGPVLGFAPDASAHKNTISTGLVVGDVGWPALPKHRVAGVDGLVGDLANPGDASVLTCLAPADCPNSSFDLRRPPGPSGLSLDIRATGGLVNNLLNGCRLKGGNSSWGLRAGPPSNPALASGRNHDLCFAFNKVLITSSGLWDGLLQDTVFDCVSSGTSGATGDMIAGGPLVGLGAFYGEFTCGGSAGGAVGGFIPSADGHFHGLSQGGTIAFLGEVHCRADVFGSSLASGALAGEPDPTWVPGTCPQTTDKPGAPKPVNVSRIKHTLACKGNVTDVRTKPNAAKGGLPVFAKLPTIRLECTIA